MKIIKYILILQFLILIGCTGVSLIQKGIRTDLYSEKFLGTIENVKVSYKQGDAALALKILNNINMIY